MRILMTACLISLISTVFSQEQQQDPRVFIEKQHRDYLNAFSQRDVEKIERYFSYPTVFNGDQAKVIINSEKLKKAYAQIFKQLPENYHHSTADRIAVIPIGNERYKAIVTASHWTEADEWLLTEEGIFYYKDVQPDSVQTYRIHHYTPR